MEDEFSQSPEPTPEEEEIMAQLRKLDQDRVNDTRKEWLEMYGFDHECSCAVDAENGKMVEVTECYAEACENAFSGLRRARAFLYAIATSPSLESSTLKALAAEAFASR